MIKNLVPRLAEVGKIKCGIKGESRKSKYGKEFMLPQKLDHFIITTLERDAAGRLKPDVALMNKLKNNGDNLTELPIRLLYDDIDLNFPTRYALYKGNKCLCSGDGERAIEVKENGMSFEINCPCKRQDPEYQGPDKCKINGTLSCIIEGSEKLGGCYKFRTTSFNSVTNILSSLAFIKTLTGGKLAWIPLTLILAPKSTTIPGSGKATTVYCASIEFRGPVQELQKLGYEVAKNQIEHKVNMENIEHEARRQMSQILEDPEEAQEIQEEFYPENIEMEKVEPKQEAKIEEEPVQENIQETEEKEKPPIKTRSRIYVVCPKLRSGGRRATEVCEKKCPEEKCANYYEAIENLKATEADMGSVQNVQPKPDEQKTTSKAETDKPESFGLF